MDKQNSAPLINVRAVIRSKSPRLERYLPHFVIRYLERILHQEELNHVIGSYRHLPGVEMAEAIYHYSNIHISVHGLDQVPLDGRYIFVSNHPLGGFDGIMLIKVIGQRFAKVKFIVNDLLLYLKSFEDVFVPVNKHGRQSQDYAKRIKETYESDDQVIYFPAGLCSRKIRGRIVDLPWKRNVIQKAITHQRDMVPVFFGGKNSNFFYRLANIRKRLHIPFNIEMLYLSDEMFRQRGSSFDIYFGKPVPYQSFTSDKSQDQWLTEVRNQVYALPQQYKSTNYDTCNFGY